MKHQMKLCKDCKHFRMGVQFIGFDKCARTTYVDPVTGGERHITCETERMSYTRDSCGPEAHYWEAKEEEDPTPWCHQCGARTEKQCKCGPIADNN